MWNRRVVVLFAVLVSTFALPLSLTGASVALPEIGRDLDAELAGVQWVVNGYNATFASFMLATGTLADLFGRRRVYAIGLAISAGAGLLAVAAGDIFLLNLLRALAGVGAAAAATSAGALLANTFQGRARLRAFSAFGMAIGAGLAFGPTTAGLLIDFLGWRAVFAVPALVAVAVLLLVPWLPESRQPHAGRLDWGGILSFTAALLLLIFGFVQGPAYGWGDPRIVAAFAATVVLLVVFVRVERSHPEPMFDLTLLATPRFVGICLAAATVVSVLVPLLVYLPSYLTTVVGLTPSAAGLTLVLLTAPTVALPLLAGALTRWVPASAVIVAAVLTVAAGAAWATVIAPTSGPADLAGPLLAIGIGVGLSIGLLDALAIASVPPHRAGTGAGMINTARLASETVAIAVVGAVLASTTAGRLADPGFTSGLRTVLWAMVGTAAFAALTVAVLVRRDQRQPDQPGLSEGAGRGLGRS
ncbi:MFS transporter [Salinispora cortesiana]|uniref:MFS transporter n=1 Tax=Salinispora cortesiana TaxID=1305843 RepID=UPI000414567C|nr:MFS transporter [Salinispora cortesiana]